MLWTRCDAVTAAHGAYTQKEHIKWDFLIKLKAVFQKHATVLQEQTSEIVKYSKKIDDDVFDELEELLIMSDVGFDASGEIIERLRQKAHEEKIKDGEQLFACP